MTRRVKFILLVMIAHMVLLPAFLLGLYRIAILPPPKDGNLFILNGFLLLLFAYLVFSSCLYISSYYWAWHMRKPPMIIIKRIFLVGAAFFLLGLVAWLLWGILIS
jgi:hypothetical protein